LSQVFHSIGDPRSKRGTYQSLAGSLALVFLGLLAGQNYLTHIQQWATHHWKILKKPLGFQTAQPPNRTTLARLLARISLSELQDAFVEFLVPLLEGKELAAAVDGKVSKQIKDENNEVLQMIEVFVHDMKIVLREWSVKGDKTNEPGCLKQHLVELLESFPQLKILTGDAIYAQRPLLRVLKDKVDYVFQVKDNQQEVYAAIKETFSNVEAVQPASKSLSKKKAA
jgi:hypothetical protein